MRKTRCVVAVLVLLASLGLATPVRAAPAGPGQAATDQVLRLGPGTVAAGRAYQLHISGTSPRPLVVVLHGWRLSVGQVQDQTGFSTYGDGHGFDVVYARSVRNSSSWNAGGCCGNDHANDVTYLAQIVKDVRSRVAITQAYVVGFSNGGMMALREICQTRVFAAAASVSGPLLVPCHRKVRALHLQGTYDAAVPLLGGYSTYTKTYFPNSLRQTAVLTVRTFKGGHEWPAGATAEIWGFLRG